jgi:hypothetical protein
MSEMRESRQKYWSEIEVEEKTKRLRDELKRAQREVGELRGVVEALTNHTHKDGRVLTDLRFGALRDFSQPRMRHDKGDDVYF